MIRPRVLFVGRSTLDAVYWLDKLPEEDTKVFARQFQAAPGGPALNAAITHSLLGGQAMLVSAVGGGPWAVPVRTELEQRGIVLFDLAAGMAYETPLTTVLVNAGNSSRTIVNPPVVPVALRQLGSSWDAEMPASWGAIPPVVLCDGFYLEQVQPLLAVCRDAGAALCLDGGSWKPGTAELAPLLTAAICSERFAVPGQFGSGQPHPSPSGDPGAIFEWFAARGVPYVAVTRGGRPILGWDRGRRFQIEVAQAAAADTLGAGDVLHGAFCHFFAQNQEFEPALRRASEIATLSCQSLGIQGWATKAG
jgi:sugar/nucleoside kinase (ribokinase family)